MAKYDTEVVRQAATGRWREILSVVSGIPDELLDPAREHPCPKCGGETRFRFIDEAAGAVRCSHCFAEKCGDGLAAVQWMLGCKFGEALEKIAEHVGAKPAKGKQKSEKVDPAKGLEWQPWSSALAAHFLAAKPGITEESLLAAGAKMARYRHQHTVIAIPIIGKDLQTQVGLCLYNYNGGTLPVWSNGEIVNQVKIKITYGSKSGLVGLYGIERLGTAGMAEVAWKVEGVSDMLALWSAIPEQLRDRHLVVTNANGAGETPRWPASILAGHNCNVLHDADQPGQAGAETWSTAIAAQSTGGQVRNVQLPYETSETHGKDLRDWLTEGHTYADLLDLADATEPVVVARTEAGEVGYHASENPIEEKILKKLQIEVLYENESGFIRVFSQHLHKSSWIRNVDNLKRGVLIQICGRPAKIHLSSDPDGEDTWSLADIRDAISMVAASRRGKDNEVGTGIWQGLDDRGNEMETVVLVGDTEGARWNGDQVLRRIIAPRADGLVLDFGAGGQDWYDFGRLEKHLAAAADVEWRLAAINQAKQLFERWRWRNQEHAPTLVTGLVMATWMQTMWEWRPLVAIAGESNAGKSYLFEALGGSANHRGIFGGLAFRQSKSTEAGFRQGIGNTGRVALCDEFEASRERNKILELLRASTRGESIARGTTDQKGRQTTLRHIGWVASVESGLSRQPDANRFIQLELLPALKGQHGKLRLPGGSELEDIGQKLLAIAIRCGIAAKALAGELKSTQADGIDARTVESYGVPAAMLAVSCGFGHDRAVGLMADLMECVDRGDQGLTDQGDLLEAILTSTVNLGPADGVRSVGQVLESETLMLNHSERLAACGVREVDGGIFVHRKTVMRQLLRGTEWEGQKIDQLLLRIQGATRAAQRIGGSPVRGISVPIATFRPDEF